jgi:hypothetical protein
MPASKLGLGVAQVNKSNLDGDALQFCSRSGANQVVPLTLFARGVKSLGLWNSMVSWPLLPGQNAGQGPIAYSFGGLGIYNLNLAASRWTSLGVICSSGVLNAGNPSASAIVGEFGGAAAILSGAATFNQPFTVLMAQDYKELANKVIVDDSAAQGFSMYDTSQTGLQTFNVDIGSTGQRGARSDVQYTRPGRNFVGAYLSGGNTTLVINSATEPLTGLGTGVWGPIIGFGGSFTISSFNTRGIETGFACVLSAQPSYNASIRTLYINTIGRGFI